MKLRVSQLAQSGATTGQAPVWNGTEWSPASGGGGGIPASLLTTKGDLIVRSDNATASNPAPTGSVLQLVVGPSTIETIVTGCDLLLSSLGASVTATIDLWESMSQSGVVKGCTARLRRDNAAGAVLASRVFTDAGDSTLGRQQQWSATFTDTAPTTGRYVLTIQVTTGQPSIYSDTRTFSLTSPVGVPSRLPVGTGVLTADPAESLGVKWAAVAVLHSSRSWNVAAAGQNTLTLGATPYQESLQVFKSGVLLRLGTDYTVSGAVVTFTAALAAADVVANYYWTTTAAPADSTLS